MVKFSIRLTVPGSISPHRTDLHEENSSVESLNRLNPLMEAVEIQVEDGRPPTAGLQAPCNRESRVNCQQVDSTIAKDKGSRQAFCAPFTVELT